MMKKFIIHRQESSSGYILYIKKDENGGPFDIWTYLSFMNITIYYEGNKQIFLDGLIPLEKILKMKAFL